MSKQWSATERGGSGLDVVGKALCRDRYAYQRLRAFGFSKQFMTDHWYVLERDRRLPHELVSEKVCKRCGAALKNNFRMFPKEVFGDKKLGRHTTADTCRTCVSSATSARLQERLEADRVARTVYDAHGEEMWTKK
jgi:hypothetical protein